MVLRESGSELDSNKANMFLMRVEDRLLAWLDANTFRNFRWEDLSGQRKDALQKAILVQAMYVFRNSDISMDSGYDPQRGVIAQRKDLQLVEICDSAFDILKSAGLYSRVIKNRKRWVKVTY